MILNNPLAPQLGHQMTLTIDGITKTEVLSRRPSYYYQLDAFLAATEDEQRPLTDGSDAVKQMQVIDRCYETAGIRLRGLA